MSPLYEFYKIIEEHCEGLGKVGYHDSGRYLAENWDMILGEYFISIGFPNWLEDEPEHCPTISIPLDIIDDLDRLQPYLQCINELLQLETQYRTVIK